MVGGPPPTSGRINRSARGCHDYQVALCCQFQLIVLFDAYLIPHFNYCSSVWGLRYKTHTDKLEKLQRRAVRVALNVNYETPSHTLCPLLHWPTITQRFKLNTALLIFMSCLVKLKCMFVCTMCVFFMYRGPLVRPAAF